MYNAFEFRPPSWRTPAQVNLHTGVLSIGTVAWFVLYIWFGVRLWRSGVARVTLVDVGLALGCILVGVWLVLGWRTVWRRWSVRMQRAAWPALSRHALHDLSPAQFEAYVGYRLFERQGYKVHNTRDVKDGGVDLVVTDGNGRRAVVQCKRYQGTVGAATVRDLYGTMIHHQATMAFLVTTGTISATAAKWAQGKPIVLIDGERLVRLARAEPRRPQASRV